MWPDSVACLDKHVAKRRTSQPLAFKCLLSSMRLQHDAASDFEELLVFVLYSSVFLFYRVNVKSMLRTSVSISLLLSTSVLLLRRLFLM
jgi:hypothetical protein